VRVTAGAPRVPDGTRPAVLYISLQHAREWISGEVTRRLLHSVVDGYGTDPDITAMVAHHSRNPAMAKALGIGNGYWIEFSERAWKRTMYWTGDTMPTDDVVMAAR